MRYWKTITRPLHQKRKMVKWYEQNKNKYEIVEIIVNNGYGFEYRELKQPCSEDNREGGVWKFAWGK